jgi:inner membrane protein
VDLLSHAVVGAATAMLVALPKETRAAALAGGIAGMLPDLDALIRSPNDALLYLEYHRHFTHSLIFIPLGALIAAGALWPLLRKALSLPRLYLFCALGIALAGLMDACTSYGTHLLWPFADSRSAWNIISVVDPVFTLLLAVPVVLALRKATISSRNLSALALMLGAGYLALGITQHHRALQILTTYATDKSLQAERLMVKPTFANLVLWRGIVHTRDSIHVAAIRPRLLSGEHRVYPGEQATRITLANFDTLPATSRLYSDIARFEFFSDNLLSFSTQDAGLLGDARYAMRPDSLRPMWSIRFDLSKPEDPAALITDRAMSATDRARFIEMLLGKP